MATLVLQVHVLREGNQMYIDLTKRA